MKEDTNENCRTYSRKTMVRRWAKAPGHVQLYSQRCLGRSGCLEYLGLKQEISMTHRGGIG